MRPGTGREGALGYAQERREASQSRTAILEYTVCRGRRDKVRPGTGREGALGYAQERREASQSCTAIQRKFYKFRANRPPRCGHLPPETRNEYVPIGSSKTSLFLKVSVGRYPHPGLGRWILSGFSSSWGRQPPHGWAAKVLLGVRRWWEGDGLPGPCETGVEKEPTRTYLWRVLVSHHPLTSWARPSKHQLKVR